MQKHHLRITSFINILLGIALSVIGQSFLVSVTYADTTPAILSFDASPSSINNDYNVLLSWTATSSSGNDLLVTCPQGVTLVRSGGSSFPCNTRTSFSTNASDAANLTVTNVSGTTRNISATVYPKDSNGADYDAGAMSTSFSVATAAQPITDFSISTSSTASNVPITLTWVGIDTPGAMVQFDCVENIQITATSPASTANLPCGRPAFSSDLARSGSVTITIKNTSLVPITITARVFPAISSGVFDSSHGLSATVMVNPVPSPVDSSVTRFTSTLSSVTSGAQFTLGWEILNASGANIQFSCPNNAMSVASIVGSSSIPLSCNSPAFTTPLATTGSTTLRITDMGTLGGSITFTLLPQDTHGVYSAITGRSVTIAVLPLGIIAPVVIAPTTTISLLSKATTTARAIVGKQYYFSSSLHRGSKGPDVTALQTLFALDPSIYPSGLISGYFGLSTLQALQKFQIKNGLAKMGESGFGLVGPKTRAFLNKLP